MIAPQVRPPGDCESGGERGVTGSRAVIHPCGAAAAAAGSHSHTQRHGSVTHGSTAFVSNLLSVCLSGDATGDGPADCRGLGQTERKRERRAPASSSASSPSTTTTPSPMATLHAGVLDHLIRAVGLLVANGEDAPRVSRLNRLISGPPLVRSRLAAHQLAARSLQPSRQLVHSTLHSHTMANLIVSNTGTGSAQREEEEGQRDGSWRCRWQTTRIRRRSPLTPVAAALPLAAISAHLVVASSRNCSWRCLISLLLLEHG